VVTFYPASGYRLHTSGTFGIADSQGDCWSCAVTGVNAYYQAFLSSLVYPTASNARAHGFSIRCVQHLQSDLHVNLKTGTSYSNLFYSDFLIGIA
jgi:hypothetical protein